MTIDNAQPFITWDFSSIAALVLLIFAIITIIDRLFFSDVKTKQSSNRKWFEYVYFLFFLKFKKSETYSNRPIIVQWSVDFFPIILVVLLLRGFVIEPFRIPSNSMMPTLLTGDFIIVNKYTYGLRMPITNTKILDIGKPKRGDVAVFRYPNYAKDETYKGADFIKRIIGLPGDEIIYTNDSLTINGKVIKYKYIGKYSGFESGISMDGYTQKRELLADNPHDVLLHPFSASRSEKTTVPAGHYFVMGDNRSYSSDSRFWGFVPESYVIGKAVAIWMHWGFNDSLKLERIGAIN